MKKDIYINSLKKPIKQSWKLTTMSYWFILNLLQTPCWKSNTLFRSTQLLQIIIQHNACCQVPQWLAANRNGNLNTCNITSIAVSVCPPSTKPALLNLFLAAVALSWIHQHHRKTVLKLGQHEVVSHPVQCSWKNLNEHVPQ